MAKIFKKSRPSLFLFSLIFSLLFISCFNALSPNPEDSQTQEETAVSSPAIASAGQLSNTAKYVNISGHFTSSGALPSSIAASLFREQNQLAEEIYYSAFPVSGTTNNDVIYYALATDVNGVEQSVEGTVDADARTYEIKHLKLGVNWKVEVGIKVKNTIDGQDVWVRCLYDVSEAKTFTEADFTLNKIFILQPDTSGTGSVDLDMNLGTNFDSTIVRLECGFDDETQRDKWDAATTEEFNFSKIKMTGLQAGVYDVTLYFYTSPDGGYPAYTTVQSINVISGMTTETWCSDGTSLITGSGTSTAFTLTSGIINEYKNSLIYVGQTSAATSVGITAGNDNEGTAYSPLASLQEAINRITALNAGSKAYRILVSGLVTGNTQINVSNTCASSITIDNTGNQADAAAVLQGSSLASVLNITTAVPVTIRHVQINGGHAENGGGINIGNNAKVTLESGALIGGTNESDPTSGSAPANSETASANYADKGGGIYSEGNLTLKNGSAVIYNYANDGGGICCNGGSLTIEAGAKVNLNGTNTTGGGITTKGTELSMTGGEVCNNISNSGVGGLDITKDSSNNCPTLITISGATISGNSADSAGGAGGIYYSGGQTLAITGNTVISGNHCKFEGGGIRVQPGVLELSDCTISGNYSDNGTRPGGGIAANAGGSIKLSGSVYIPSGATIGETFRTGNGCNDVRQNYDPIKIKGALTPPAECIDGIIATITPNTAVRGSALLEAEGSITNLTSYKDNFALTYADAGWKLKLSSDNTALTLDAPIYVSTSGSSAATTTGTKNDPFRTIQDAISTALTDTNVDYTILIDGELRATTVNNNGTINGYAQEIIDPGEPAGSTIKAKSITIRGASASNGNPTDVINGLSADGTKRARGLFIGTKIPVTIENLKITGGLADEGGGIYLSGEDTTLTLGNDVLITGNKANNSGGGIYLNKNTINNSCPTLNIKGNVKICDNTNSVSGDPSNLYLPDGAKITVTGALTKGSNMAKIGISTQNNPNQTSSVRFTSGYNTYNSGIAPGTYFHGDKWAVRAVASGEYAGEAELAANGGSITIEPIYENIIINVDKTSILNSASEKKFTFSASGTDSEGNTSPITIGSGEGQLALTIDSVTYHGETVPASYYDTGTNYVILNNSMPEGSYTINTRAVYQGSLSAARPYSACFEVNIVDEILTALDSAPTEGTWTISGQIGLEKLAEWGQAGALNPGATYILENDVTLSNWTSMGNFEGTFDGNDHTITILSLAEGSKNIFGDVRNSSSNIKNLTVAGSITGEYQGLVGILGSSDQGVNNHYTRMENCVNKVNITYTGTSYCGGLAGKAGSTYSHIINCRNEGNITALNSSKVGGITGESGSTANSIIHCINTGNITGKNCVGGICGGSTGTIRDCMNSGTIKGEDYVGGLCGRNIHICNSINTGIVEITKTNGYTGGICGYYESNFRSIKNCVNRGSVIKAAGITSLHIGAIAGNTWDNIQKAYYLSTDSIIGIGGETADVSGNCDSFTKSGSACLTSSDITVGTYTGKDVVSLLNAFVDGGYINTDNIESEFPPKRWKYDSNGNIEFDE